MQSGFKKKESETDELRARVAELEAKVEAGISVKIEELRPSPPKSRKRAEA
jgi:hypothetical protein